MPVHPRELSDEQRVIDTPVFCEKCSYELRRLPKSGCCPECGNSYDIRGLRHEGIFTPHNMDFPAADIFAGVASLVLTIWLVLGLIQGLSFWSIILAITFAVLSWMFFTQGYQRLMRFISAQRALHQFFNEEE